MSESKKIDREREVSRDINMFLMYGATPWTTAVVATAMRTVLIL